MVRYARWLLTVRRRHYFAFVELTLDGLVLVAGAFGMGVAALYLGLSFTQYLVTVVWVGLCLSLAIRLGCWSCGATLRPIRAWLNGDPASAVAAWNAALAFPSVGPRRALWFTAPCGALTFAPLVAFGVDGTGLAAYAAGLTFMSLAANQNMGVSTRDLMRPIIDEISPLVPATEAPRAPQLGVGQLVGRAMFAAAYVTGVSVPAVVLGTRATPRDFAVAIAVSLVVSALIGGDTVNRVAKPLVLPIADLLRGNERVRRGDLSEAVVVSSADEFGELALAFNTMQQGLRERAALHVAFGSYVDPALTQRLIESGSSIFEGEELEVTVMFADVRGFTSYSENVTPRQAVELLNRLFDVIVPLVQKYGGHANHYLGDGLLAVFGAPVPLPGHADAAVLAAMEICRDVEVNFADELRIGIGINTGRVIAGTVGGGGRHEFTVIGDPVNVAARVEQLTKETGDPLLITEATRLAMSPLALDVSTRGTFNVRGKSAGVRVHAVLQPEREADGHTS